MGICKIPVRRNSKTDWDACLQAAKKGEFSKIPPDIMMRYYGNINRLYKDFCPIVHSPALRGIYIYGKSGIGKSTLARALFLENLFIIRIIINGLMDINRKL